MDQLPTTPSEPTVPAQQPPASQLQPPPTAPAQTPVVPQTTQPPPKRRNRLFLLLGIFALLILGSIGAFYMMQSQSLVVENTAATTPTPLVSKKIVIGTDASFPPMEFVDDRGQFAGYDIDLGKKIAEELGVQAEFKQITWEKLFQAVIDKEVDMVMSSTSITDERKKTLDFSNPYINAGQVLITLKTNTSIASASAMKGKKIGVSTGTTNVAEALKYNSRENVTEYEKIPPIIADIRSGKLDATIQDLTGAKGIVNENSDLKIASDPFTIENYGIVFRKGNEKLVSEVNTILERLREKGILDEIKQKWF